MNRLPLLLWTCALLLSGCGNTVTFRWREQEFELPELALEAQKNELRDLLDEVPEALEEDRLGGRVTVVLPTAKGIRASWHGNQAADLEGRTFYATSKASNEASFRAQALERAGLFKSVKVEKEDTPGSREQAMRRYGSEGGWLLYASPDPGTRDLRWGLMSGGTKRVVEVGHQTLDLSEDRLDAFVNAVSAAGAEAKQGDGGRAGGSGLPVGWRTFTLPPGGGSFKVGFPVVPELEAKVLPDWRSWTVQGWSGDLQLHVYASQAKPGGYFGEGSTSNRRDEIRRDINARVLLDQDRPLPEELKGCAEKWVLMQREDNGVTIVLRVVRTPRWLVSVAAAGPVLRGRAPTRASGDMIWNCLVPTVESFLASMHVNE